MKHIFFPYFYILFFLCSCKAQEKITKCNNQKQIEIFIRAELNKLKHSGVGINEKIVLNVASTNPNLEQLFTSNQFSFIKNFDVQSIEGVIKFDKLFTEKDFVFLKNQINCNKEKIWSSILGDELLKNETNDQYINFLSYSIPVFSKDRIYAFVYVESEFSGELKVYKKVNDKWIYFAQATVWIS